MGLKEAILQDSPLGQTIRFFQENPEWYKSKYLSQPLYESFPELAQMWWAQHWLNPESYPREEIPIPLWPGTVGGPKFSGDVNGLQQMLFRGEKPWSAVGTTKHVEGMSKAEAKEFKQQMSMFARFIEMIFGGKK